MSTEPTAATTTTITESERKTILIRPKVSTSRSGSSTQPNLQLTFLYALSGSLAAVSQVLKPNANGTTSGKTRYLRIKDQQVLQLMDQDQQWAVQYVSCDSPQVMIPTVGTKPLGKPSFGVLCKVSDDGCFVMKTVSKLPLRSKQKHSLPFRTLSTLDKPTLNTAWKEKSDTSVKHNDFKLSMTPPNLLNNSPEKEHQTPFEYFGDKYYENLYELNIPLTYFVKSSFTRLFNMCGKDRLKYSGVLKRFVITEEAYLQRHDLQRNGVMNQSLTKTTSELKYQGKFIERHFNLLDLHEKFTNPAMIDILRFFEVKELQLQILVVMEIIFVEKLDRLELFDERARREKQSKQKKKKSIKLGKMKNFQKVLIPSLATSKSNIQDSNSSSLRMSSPPIFETIDYNLHLEELLEKSLYAGQILGRRPVGFNDLTDGTASSGATASNSDDNSSSTNPIKLDKFINRIAVPFFDKKCPNTLRFIISKIKGTDREASSGRVRTKSVTKLSVGGSNVATPETVIEEDEEDEATTPRDDLGSDLSVRSTVSNPNAPPKLPALKRSTLKDHFQASTLKRTTSDLLSRQASFTSLNLAKKQMISFQDVERPDKKKDSDKKRSEHSMKPSSSESKSKSNAKAPKLSRSSSAKSLSSTKMKSEISFGKSIGKPQAPVIQSQPPQSFTQVEATPMKKNKSMIDLDESIRLAPPPSFKRSLTSLTQPQLTSNTLKVLSERNGPTTVDEAEITIDSSPIGSSLMMIDSSPIAVTTTERPLQPTLRPNNQVLISSSPLKDILGSAMSEDPHEDESNQSPLAKRRKITPGSKLNFRSSSISSSPPSTSNNTVKKISYAPPPKLQIISNNNNNNPSDFDPIKTPPTSSHSFGNSTMTLETIMDTPISSTRLNRHQRSQNTISNGSMDPTDDAIADTVTASASSSLNRLNT
ncbi:hypothetical protein WICPIJ_007901 [Wickerhamomyces pijperi]|uniref:DNA replication regulator Sld3 C-terminal domain-containing protein n=1 Tax=Wickerhamomyces pijperi TaxID=599730 RepID=A0A9P8TK02_WICPI|nr:hypothetical protein WICPIJ_007901 [Wickerhamomyces pijperi]